MKRVHFKPFPFMSEAECYQKLGQMYLSFMGHIGK